MKSLKNFLVEGKGAEAKYGCNWIKKGEGVHVIFNNNIAKLLSEVPNDAEYYDIFDNRTKNTSEITSLIQWGGQGGFWANMVDDSFKYPGKKKLSDDERQQIESRKKELSDAKSMYEKK